MKAINQNESKENDLTNAKNLKLHMYATYVLGAGGIQHGNWLRVEQSNHQPKIWNGCFELHYPCLQYIVVLKTCNLEVTKQQP